MKSPLIPITIFAAALCAVCASCSGGRSAATGDGPVTIDVAAKYPAEDITLQTIAEVEYIPLAIAPEVLLTPSDRVFHLSDSHIMVANRGRGDINIFNRDGSIASHFNRRGRGPGEYATISDILFDEAAGEIYVGEMTHPGKFHVYTPAGKHLRTIPAPEGWVAQAWNFDATHLLAYYVNPTLMGVNTTKPYRLISKADGSVTDTLAIDIPMRYSTQTIMSRAGAGPGGQTLYQVMMIQTINHRLGGSDFTLADISSDTIYRYTRERVLTPAFTRTPSVHASEPRVVWTTALNTPSFTLFEVSTLDFDRATAGNGYDQRRLMYDPSTGRIVEPTFRDANHPSAEWTPPVDDIETPNTAVTLLDPLKLTEANEKGELSGPLADLAANIKEDDNPVVMIVKFKQ